MKTCEEAVARTGELDLVSGMKGIDQTAAVAEQAIPDPRLCLVPAWQGGISERFACHVDDRAAIETPEDLWSYRELDLASAALADRLAQLGLNPGDPIGVYASRKASLVVALLAIIRAGLSFVILDPSYPLKRTLQCLRLAQPRGIINLLPETSFPEELRGALPNSGEGVLAHLPERKAELLQACSTGKVVKEHPRRKSASQDVLYTAFTSGSTGAPKAVVGTHGPVAHFFSWQQKRFNLGRNHRVSVLSGLAHDPLLRDVLMPLWIGGTICVPPQECYEIPNRLLEWMRDARIQVAHLTPSLGRMLLRSSRKSQGGQLDKLHYVFFGGEILNYSLVQALRESAPNATVVNCYGATETPQVMGFHVTENGHDSALAKPDHTGVVPIGRGIDGVQLLVLNEEQQLCAPGQQGQIAIRSPYLAKAVLGPEGLPLDAFKVNPFNQDPEDLMYPTGDFGHYLSDGTVVYSRRKDRQIKIRGHRVELGEIDGLLAGNRGIIEHYVDIEPTEAGDPKLVLYVVLDSSALTVDLVRSMLSDKIPDYMLPERIVEVNKIPLTPNGKTDTAALRQAGIVKDKDRDAAGSRVLGSQTTAARLLQIVADGISDRALGLNQDFFKAGMNSLSAVNVCCEIEREFGVTISVQDLVQSGNVSALASNIEGKLRGAPSAGSIEGLDGVAIDGTPVNSSGIPQCGNQPRLIPEHERLFVGIKNRIFQLFARVMPDVWRVKLHKLRGVTIGTNVSIGYDTIIESSYPWLVRIGSNVNIGMRVTVIGHFRGMRSQEKRECSVDIRDYAFVGPQVVILPNVIIGEGAVITAGSVVAKSIPPYVMAHGNPAVPVARCGVALSGPTSYEDFVRQLKPL